MRLSVIEGQWIKAGVAYGYASDTYTRSTMDKTDQVLHQLTQRIVLQATGPRMLCGDFNHSKNSLPQFATWRQHGFVELQEYARQKWARPIAATTPSGNVIDHVWISSELIPLLESVHVETDWFADHHLVYGKFRPFGHAKPVPIWRKPLPIPWDEVPELPCPSTPFAVSQNETSIPDVFRALETRVDKTMQQHDMPGLLPQQKGRCLTRAPCWQSHVITPLKPSRPNEVQVTFLGESFTHTKWCRQMRRLQSLKHLVRSPKSGASHVLHMNQLWASVRNAPGFPKGFPYAWANRSIRLPGSPDFLPRCVPSPQVCEVIFQSFRLEFEGLEKALRAARLKHARVRREADRNVTFKDVARPRSLPVQTLVQTNTAAVTAIDDDHCSFTYEPQALELQQPVFSSVGMLAVTEHTAGHIRCSQEVPFEVGDAIHQESLVGDVHAVFQAFHDLWSPMWNKHTDTPFDDWVPLMTRIADQVPRPDHPFVWTLITSDEWLAAARRRPAASATGPDGVARNDLLKMPMDLVQTLVDAINRIERDGQQWPQSCMVGLITSIEKHDRACQVGEYRPITVLSQVYRNWSSIRSRQLLQWMDGFCPPGMTGNRPGISTKHLWWRMAQSIESGHCEGSALGGIVTDVVKCFNTLPRPIVAFTARHIGVPAPLVTCWHQAVSQVERRFVVAGCCGDPIFSVTGYPEGDGLSVVAMSILNLAMHSLMQVTSPLAGVLSYVDNWELFTQIPECLPDAFSSLCSLAKDFDIRLDVKKSYAWALQSNDRAMLRKHFEVKFDARDLGGHISYCKRKTMHTLSARMANHADSWTWLARSVAPTSQKLQLLSAVMWPRMLHGVSGLWISDSHCKKLRAKAMQSLGWKRKGASSVVQFGLSSDLKADPGFHCVACTILNFRRYCQPEIAFPVVTRLAHLAIPRYTPGPCGAFLHRLHELNWHWESDGFFRDHDGLRMHILDTPLQLLQHRMKLAWVCVIGGIVSSRKTYTGLQHVDLSLSHQMAEHLDPMSAGLLRAAMNGTFFTRDAQVHAGKAPDKSCPFCSLPDSVAHRHWECGFFSDIRKLLPRDVLEALPQFPECTRIRGWMTAVPKHLNLMRCLSDTPDTTKVFCASPFADVLHLFSDGSCIAPTAISLRVATWGVCCADLQNDTFVPVSSGVVTGLLHTTLRGELTAAISACTFGNASGRPYFLWTDNQLVHDRVRAILLGVFKRPTVMMKDHDLWTVLFDLVREGVARKLFGHVVKVRSHEDPQQYSDIIDQFAIAGNDAADALALQARQGLSVHFWKLWTEVADDLLLRTKVAKEIQQMIIRIGTRVIAHKQALAAQADQAWNVALQTPISHEVTDRSLVPLRPWTDLPAKHTMTEIAADLSTWLERLTSGADQRLHWVAAAHLLIHFQQCQGHHGYKFNQATNRWNFVKDHVAKQGFSFRQCANWLLAAARCYTRLLGIPYISRTRLPDGKCFRSWTPCILIQMKSEVFWQLDDALSTNGITEVRSVKKAFSNFRAFCAST